MILAATGHRPNKLGGYGPEVLKRLIVGATTTLTEEKPDAVISGMALGWDTAWALAALDLGVPLLAAVPFAGQDSRWPDANRDQYRQILSRAASVKVVCDGGYTAWKMHARNAWMVNRCDKLIALWDGTPGGTASCVAYARRKRKPVENLWRDWYGGVFA